MQEYVAVWSGRKMVVYGISQDKSLVRVAGETSSKFSLNFGAKRFWYRGSLAAIMPSV